MQQIAITFSCQRKLKVRLTVEIPVTRIGKFKMQETTIRSVEIPDVFGEPIEMLPALS